MADDSKRPGHGAAPQGGGRVDRAIGLLRSLWIYHGIPGRRARLRAFYRPLVPPGGLAFDIGAHLGNRTLAWRRLGARVVAVEPQPDCLRVLHHLFARDRAVTVLPVAVGEAEGEAQLLVSARTPTVSTLSADWAQRVGATPAFRGVRWSGGVRVPVTTLDALIARHGRPDFVKIDVEGSELDVLEQLAPRLRSDRPITVVEVLPPYDPPMPERVERQKRMEALFRSLDMKLFRIHKDSSPLRLEPLEEFGIFTLQELSDHLVVPSERVNDVLKAFAR